jgi:hypothetical protein
LVQGVGVNLLTPAPGIGPQGLHALGHFLDRGHPLRGIGRGDLKHFQAAAQTNFVQQLLGVLYPFASSEISFQEMAAASLSPAHEDSVGPGLEPLQNVDDVDAAGTQVLDDAHRGRVLHPGRARHIRRSVSAIRAHISQYLRSEIHLRLPVTFNFFLGLSTACCQLSAISFQLFDERSQHLLNFGGLVI